jgi:hypothetical protein
MIDTPIQITELAPNRLRRAAEGKLIRPANLRLKLEPDGDDLGAKAALLRRHGHRTAGMAAQRTNVAN